ncbi:hypothetical protein [Nocardia sp. NPDC052112]|uniref:hypothetical protein n=1 Tax=Nocardia sp. NPDC052112 TaxID=3155646 RepID=UPI00342EAE3C
MSGIGGGGEKFARHRSGMGTGVLVVIHASAVDHRRHEQHRDEHRYYGATVPQPPDEVHNEPTIATVRWQTAAARVAASDVRDRRPDGTHRMLVAAQFSLSHLAWLLTYPIAGWPTTVAVEIAGVAKALPCTTRAFCRILRSSDLLGYPHPLIGPARRPGFDPAPRQPQVTTIVFIVTSYSGQTFDQIENAFSPPGRRHLRHRNRPLRPDRRWHHTGLVMGKLFRPDGVWQFGAIGDAIRAQHPVEAIPRLRACLT